MQPDEIELHDARLVSIESDYVAGRVTISVEYYPLNESSTRVPAQIIFTGVSQFHQLTNLDELKDHAAAGNISQWIPASGQGTTFIYLVRGLIAVTASTVAVIRAA